ncbi:PREDICTED: uncharacterized protein PF11_0207-like [Ipomoea nil]|uniref:uncharacterized protein PF11_0207-like n=1 Tax=Ipomoea nil TaxID=35883 RepID=UPI000901E5F6|nr:PREDICTED: uncharacterized protein PF11_0207-like [Ipomoea nil]XP_019161948.1 PREDICTED: uncharacterized protein PF11_0207-like [Ipomoea nil]XP_019178387.1 PREDICTED: uncharacterized protein PF11_0207-like [Ipomoea nil]XP_019195666.1 PREDICTED: uncharacterized protein PF11_0207-like [Ipomoea nil]XP_019197410.1 PREDICTED: uncharacterized protein PF11_0207-like [Ipomoea nil]XP_019197411.1 PREDICTED: uncharacterized protein PF11_0207-like [Ipomoea nil]XP_019197718.1 PREDICTED: uncharacterized
MSAAQKLVNVAVCLVCMFVLTVDASLSSVYQSCFDPCHSACKDTGKTVFACGKECERGCTDKAYKEGKLKDESKELKEEEKELWAFQKKQVKEYMDMRCKDFENKQCKDDDKECKDEAKFCKDMHMAFKEENKQLKDEDKLLKDDNKLVKDEEKTT